MAGCSGNTKHSWALALLRKICPGVTPASSNPLALVYSSCFSSQRVLPVVLPSPAPATPALLLLCSRLWCREQPQGTWRLIFTRCSSFCSTPVWSQSSSDWGEDRKLLTVLVSAPPRGDSQGKELKDTKAVLASVPVRAGRLETNPYGASQILI